MKKITRKEWEKFVALNCNDSYSLVICLTVLMLWEHGIRTEEEADKVMSDKNFSVKGLSGNQALTAIGFSLNYEIPDWLDKEMVKVSKKRL